MINSGPPMVWVQLTAGKGSRAKRSPLLEWNMELRQKRSKEVMGEFEVGIGDNAWVPFG